MSSDQHSPSSLTASARPRFQTTSDVANWYRNARPVRPQIATLAPTISAVDMLKSIAAQEHPARQSRTVQEALTGEQPDFDALAAFLSTMAEVAYGSDDEICARVAGFNGANVRVFRRGGAAAFGATLAGHALLAFRGTTGVGQLILTDFNLLPCKWPIRHMGFVLNWQRIRADVRRWLEALPADTRRVVLTGHSLGGAVAVLAAYELAEVAPIRAVITFGAPRVGMFVFRHSYNTRECGGTTLHAVTRRYTNAYDTVSRVPPPLLYCHVGEEMAVDESGAIGEGKPCGFIERFQDWLDGWKLKHFGAAMLLPGVAADPLYGLRQARLNYGLKAPAAQQRYEGKQRVMNRFMSTWNTFFGLVGWVPAVLLAVITAAAVLIAWTRMRDIRYHFCRRYVEAFRRSYSAIMGSEPNTSWAASS